MKLSADCMFCLVAGQQENIKHFEDEDKKSVYMREVLQIIVDSGPKATAPVVVADINKLHQATFGVSYSFEALKKEYNRSLLQNEAGIKLRIDSAGNKLLAAVKFARAGNYIDFGAMKQIDKEKLNLLLESAQGEGIDPVEFAAFEHDLQTAENLVYLLDNCGEIVLDKLLIQTIQNRYP